MLFPSDLPLCPQLVTLYAATLESDDEGTTTLTSPSRSGVFSAQPDQRVEHFTESISYDHRLAVHDVQVSAAHARMLVAQGHLTAEEGAQIASALAEIERAFATGDWQPRTELEDIHMHLETALTDRLGDVGRKLHTARSRNDLVSTDLRLWVRHSVDVMRQALQDIQRAFVDRAEGDLEVILPAYTHLQRAQPVLAAHYWLAYCEKLERDRERLADCRRRANICPLGTAAVAGTSLQIDRHQVAAELGFDGISNNSLDASSDRDFAIEFAFALAMIATHLSGLAEEWILWSTSEFGLIELPQQFCTGSSIMPQKINPDVMELIRGKAARVMGNLQTLLVLVKGLPLAYNRDLQEDKPPLFDSFDQVLACCQLLPPIIQGLQFRHGSIQQRLEDGYLDATTMMEYFIRRGVPQRVAHQLCGSIVRYAMERQRRLAELAQEEFQALGADVDASIYDYLGVERAVASFISEGSTGPAQVAGQLAAWRQALAAAGQ